MFPTLVTEHIKTQLAKTKSKALAKQFIASPAEEIISSDELTDPIGDSVHSPVTGIIHRYKDRCLLLPINVCPIYCRFCFRKNDVGPLKKILSKEELAACYNYISNNKNLWEVILSGGDPLILKPKYLEKILLNLEKISHVKVMRIHTKVPLVDPKRINEEMLAALNKTKAVYLILHCNHPDEITPAGLEAIHKLLEANVVILSQTVLLKNINDNIDTLSKLMRTFVANRIIPYYLHHLDKVTGSKHFRVSIKKGQEIMRQLRGDFSGLCQPNYVLDIPGGFGKVPIGPEYICEHNKNYKLTDINGNAHTYYD